MLLILVAAGPKWSYAQAWLPRKTLQLPLLHGMMSLSFTGPETGTAAPRALLTHSSSPLAASISMAESSASLPVRKLPSSERDAAAAAALACGSKQWVKRVGRKL